MICVIDTTLACLERYTVSSQQLAMLLEALIAIKVDYIELTPSIYRKLGTLNPKGKYILRLSMPGEALQFPEFSRFVCPARGMSVPNGVTTEVQVNDLREAYLLRSVRELPSVRITGLDDLLLHDWQEAFVDLRARMAGRVEFCPENQYFCATALAVEWVLGGGTDIVTSFGGLGHKAPLEEVLLALRLQAHHKPGNQFSCFPAMKALIEEITGQTFPHNKPVIGSNIFHVESGIHVDGILKRQQLYEPYFPELVGSERRFVLGKHSGLQSIRLKLQQNGLNPEAFQLAELLDAVRGQSIDQQGCVPDDLFLHLAQGYRKEEAI
ncbi:isopropylmalate synthase [Oscillospiraceae bacterium MB08-C2-2]|nr:isopropylmalate synthase [Oscillospiraceae bacterium MB08-C2-2]